MLPLNLDLGSFFIISSMVELTISLGFLFLWRHERKRYLLQWAAGYFLIAIAFLLITSRNRIPDFFSIVVANVCLGAASVGFYEATCRLLGVRHLSLPRLLFAGTMVPFLYFTYGDNDINARIYLIFVLQSAIAFLHARTIFRYVTETERRSQRDVAVFMAFLGIVMLARGVGAVLHPWPQNLHAAGDLQVLTLAAGLVAHVGIAMGFMNMHSACLLGELSTRTAALERANVQLQALSATDELTGIANRRKFDIVFDGEWRRAARQGMPLAVLMIDVDHFKAYNDCYGHQRGDECLRRVAQVLDGMVHRFGEVVARYGGEEFVFILPGLDIDRAVEFAERARQTVEAQEIPHCQSTAADVVTISIGVSAGIPDRSDRPSSMLREADTCLYQAKHLGRNRVARPELQALTVA